MRQVDLSGKHRHRATAWIDADNLEIGACAQDVQHGSGIHSIKIYNDDIETMEVEWPAVRRLQARLPRRSPTRLLSYLPGDSRPSLLRDELCPAVA